MKSTTLCIRCFLHVMLCTLSKADMISQHYILDPSLDNKVSNNSLMTKHHSESLIECSAKCGELCVCFGFNPQLKKCRIHQSCDPANMTVDETGWRYFRPNDWDRDCEKLQENGHTRSGDYKIKPFGKSSQSISVYCYMETSGGGWTAIQRRITGSVDFYRTWNEYKVGFGIPEAYWIGNDAIHQLTKGGNTSLYVAITLQNDTTLYELYEQFSVSDEADKYRLLVNGSATGTLGDRLRNGTFTESNSVWTYVTDLAAGNPFSTRDQDNDSWEGNCAVFFQGAWWFNACLNTHLNGPWNSKDWYRLWHPVVRYSTEVKGTLMMIKLR